ncbi:MAG: CPBP family intramembrane metalloprotease [Clostridiales bacterium]|nr:CPBP family intramembrane metalloprotease [Clostridiales bacterium]
MFISALSDAVVQVILFSVIPLIWWLITARKKENFFHWLGFHKFKAGNRRQYLIWFFGVLAGSFAVGEFAILIRGDLSIADSAYKGLGLAAVPSVAMYSFIQTALSEEIFFRGFLLKRLANQFGFRTANIIQASIFGVIHLLEVWGQTDFIAGAVIVIYPVVVALLLGYINEKKSDGSVYPSWIIHGTLNTVENILQAMM